MRGKYSYVVINENIHAGHGVNVLIDLRFHCACIHQTVITCTNTYCQPLPLCLHPSVRYSDENTVMQTKECRLPPLNVHTGIKVEVGAAESQNGQVSIFVVSEFVEHLRSSDSVQSNLFGSTVGARALHTPIQIHGRICVCIHTDTVYVYTQTHTSVNMMYTLPFQILFDRTPLAAIWPFSH